MNVPLKEYSQMLKAQGIELPEDSKFLENKELIYALLEKMSYIGCRFGTLNETVALATEEATQLLRDLKPQDGIVHMPYYFSNESNEENKNSGLDG